MASNSNHHSAGIDPRPPRIEVHLCVPEDQARYVPRRRRGPWILQQGWPLPRQGEVYYLSPHSAWGVELVVHEWKTDQLMRVEVWLRHVKSTQHERPTGFSLTQ